MRPQRTRFWGGHALVGHVVRLACVVNMLAGCLLSAAAEEPVELHVWGLSMGETRAGWYALVEAFEKEYPNIKVVFGPADRGEDLQKLLCGVVGSVPPDVFRREANLFGDIAARGILMPLDKFIEQDKSLPDGLHEENYPTGLWQACKWNGRVYAIAEGSGLLCLSYNKAVFREAGLDPEKPPRTWDEWRDMTEKLTVRDARGRVTRLGNMMTRTLYSVDDLSFYVRQLGGDVLSKDGRESLLDSPEALRAIKFVASMYEAAGGRRAFDDFSQTNEATGIFPQGDGRIAMSVEDDSIIYRAMLRKPDMELGIAPVPTPDGRPPISLSDRHALYLIPHNARHPKEAWQFIRFALSPKGQIPYFDACAEQTRARGNTLVYPGFRADRKVREAVIGKYPLTNPVFAAAYANCEKLVPYLVPPTANPVNAILRDEMIRAVDRVLYGEMTAEQALHDADRRVQGQLDIYNKRDSYPLLNWAWVWVGAAALIVGTVSWLAWSTRNYRARSSMQKHDNRMGIVFIGPWALGFIVFTAGPMIFSLAMSFCSYDVIHPARFVGLDNYSFLLANDPLFWKSLWNTVFMVVALPLGMSVSLILAMLLNTKVKGMAFYRTIFYLPAITPAVATAVLWYALLNPEGLINLGLRELGLHPPSWLGDKSWSKPAIVFMGLWGAGGGMIMWLAGLQGIPAHLYEAASIDGAGRIRQFFSVTLPMLTPYIFFSFVTGIIGVFQIFAQALILTRGGPADSTLFYVYYLFNNAFRYFKMGYASAQAWVLFLLVLLLTLVQWRMSKRWVHYE
ncbi:MAG: extracellular solute-binding protein [Candidatus Hydrogenedentes bacterium]|nr:extracellular solute-binding protein [Candidatus Hydrogenedentota bacterium]